MSRCMKVLRSLVSVFLGGGSSFVLAVDVFEVPEASKVISSLGVDLVPNLKNQKILVLKEESGDVNRKMFLVADVDAKQSVILEAPFALPLIKNAYSPASYDGFDVGVLMGGIKLSIL